MKKRVFLRALVALALLSSIMLSSLLGVTNAEFFKKLSRKLDFEIKPDLAFQYYLVDADTPNSGYNDSEHNSAATYQAKTGVYKNGKNILQPITVGIPSSDARTIAGVTYYFGDSVVYQITIPVDEPGYYTLNFNVDFYLGNTQDPYQVDLVTGHAANNATGGAADKYVHPENDYYEDNFFSMSYQYCMGCEVLTDTDSIKFGDNTPLRLANRISANDTKQGWQTEKIYYADSATDSVYQWKTLTPSRAENVKLAFKATTQDVNNGYVVWAWDFSGIKGNHNYRLSLTDIDIEKTMEIDGSTKNRAKTDPFFMFPQTSFTNSQIYPNHTFNNGATSGTKSFVRGSNVPGKTGYSDGRGTFITEATENSLGLRAEAVHAGVTPKVPDMKSDNWYTDNPVSLQIPVKNVQFDKTYKVTFDFSIARQGNKTPDNQTDKNVVLNNKDFGNLFKNAHSEELKPTNYYDYADFTQIFRQTSSETQFRAYLYSTSDLGSIGKTNNDHKENRKQITYAHKAYNSSDHSLVKYNDVTRLNSTQSSVGFPNFPNYTTMDVNGTVNDTFCAEVQSGTYGGVVVDATKCRNWFNAVQHVEQNGQQGINWITFYNTTFAFNIDSVAHHKKDANGNLLYLDENKEETTEVTNTPVYDIDLDNLYWVWQIDSLYYMGWYNIRIDNVRFEEVVQYGSELENNGVKIGLTQIGRAQMHNYGKDLQSINPDTGVFNNYRGWNGTGQNCNPRGFDTDNYFAAGNIYAPIVDARQFAAAPGGGTGANDYKIYLNGTTVCKGGITKYVYSVDGGKTWNDMTFSGVDADASVLANAELGVESHVKGQSSNAGGRTNYVEFKGADRDHENADYRDFNLVADLTDYKNMPNLEIIIAAIPNNNQKAHCEILRIINYNSANMYISRLENITSDIMSTSASTGTSTAITIPRTKMSITSLTSGNSDYWPMHYYPVSDRGVFANSSTRSKPIRYNDLQATYSGIPVKTTLTVTGYIIVSGTIEQYAFSVDGGRTWEPITRSTKYHITEYSSANNIATGDLTPAPSVYEKLLFKWLTRNATLDETYFKDRNGLFTGNGKLSINLSKYEGQVVDVIVGAKPTGMYNNSYKTEIYLPVAKIDNVAVYGNNGTFYTRVHKVVLDGRTNVNINGDPTKTAVTAVLDHVADKSKMNGATDWGLGYSSEMGYTIFEPYNVSALNARQINNSVNSVKSGGRVTIDGYVFCKGGVKSYKFSLDGGKSWTPIHDTGTNITETMGTYGATKMMEYAKTCDSTFSETDGTKGGFCCTGLSTSSVPSGGATYGPGVNNADDRKKFYDNALEFILPSLPHGAVRNLLVVAESNYGKIIPVLSMKLSFVNNDDSSVMYGYYRNTQSGGIEAGWISGANAWTFPVAKASTHRNIMTIPVTHTGSYTLKYVARLENTDGTNSDTYLMERRVKFTALHDSGKDTLFANLSTRFSANDSRIMATSTVPGYQGTVNMPLTITADDVKRGYIVLDIDVSGLPTSGLARSSYYLRVDQFELLSN